MSSAIYNPPAGVPQSQHIFMLAHQLSSGRENNFAFPPIQLHHDSAGTPPPEIIRVSSHRIQVSSWCWCTDSWARYNSRVLPNPTYLMLAHQLSCRENNPRLRQYILLRHDSARTPAPETIPVFLQIQVSSSCWRAHRLCARYNSYGVLPNWQQSSSCQRTSSCVRDLQVAVSSFSFIMLYTSCWVTFSHLSSRRMRIMYPPCEQDRTRRLWEDSRGGSGKVCGRMPLLVT